MLQDLAHDGQLGTLFLQDYIYDWSIKPVWTACLALSEAARFVQVQEAIVDLSQGGADPLGWELWRKELLTNWSGDYAKRVGIAAEESLKNTPTLATLLSG